MNSAKLSKYNYFYQENNKQYVFNALTGENVQLSSTIIEDWDLQNDMSLREKGIVLSQETKEEELVEKIYTSYIKQKELFLIILPTEQCNLRCAYCYEKFSRGKMTERTQSALITYIEQMLDGYQELYISWFGGEPLLAMDVIERLSSTIMEFCRKKKINYRAGITTNGVKLTKSIVEKLLDYNVLDYQVTLDGDQALHDKQRVTVSGGGTFAQIYYNLKEMRSIKRNFGVIMRTNIGQNAGKAIFEYIDNIKRDFMEDERFMLHFVAIADLTGDIHKTIDLCDTYQLLQYYHYAKKLGISFKYYRSLYKPTGMICYAANPNSMVIGSDGQIYKCTVAFEEEMNKIGYIDEAGKVVIDKERLRLWTDNGYETSEKCDECKFKPICYGKFCPLEKILRGKEPCPPFKKYIREYLEIMK